ncbi:MAG: hypothetical protein AB7E13_05730 [Arcobacteraceae bacterium]|jgi:DNA-binding NtrC family response regulator
MKILIIDEYIALAKVLQEYLNKHYSSIKVDVLNDIKRVNSYLHDRTNYYDIVVINFGSFNNNKLLDNVLKHDPKQRTVIISSDAKCTDNIGCEHCIKKYNKVRLIPPFGMHGLMDYIVKNEGQECPHYKHCDNFKFVV